MTVGNAVTRLSAVGMGSLIGVGIGVTVPGVLQVVDLFSAIRDNKRRRDAQTLCRCIAEGIEALRQGEYARPPADGVFAAAVTICTDTLDRHGLDSADFLRLGLQPERAADAVLDHAAFNSTDRSEGIPAAARRILVCFYARLREEKDLLRAVLPDIYSEIMRQGETLDDIADDTKRIIELVQQPPIIDIAVVRAIAEKEGFLPPEKAKALEETIARTQQDLERIREAGPYWRAEVDAAIQAFNRSDIDEAKAAFARLDALIAEHRNELKAQERELRQEEARSKHAQATLFYPFEASRSEPLLTQAAELAETNIWYWIECGRARLAIGSLARAATAFQRARDLAEASGSEHGVGAALDSFGDATMARGDLAGALEAYASAKAIAEQLAATDPGNTQWQFALSVSWEKIGNVRMAEGDLTGALGAYAEGHAIADKLAAEDPDSAKWQRALSVSWEKIGNVRMAEGDRSGALEAYGAAKTIRDQLAAAEPSNAGWQHDLSVSWNKIGDVRTAQGDLAGALEAYTQSHAIADKLAAEEPSNAEWQHGLAIGWEKIGDLRVAQGDLAGALVAYKQRYAIVDKLAAAEPSNAAWQRDLIVSHVKLREVAAETADARVHLTAALEIARALEAAGRLAPVDAWMPAALERLLGVLDN